MAGSTLDPDNVPPRRRRKTVKGSDMAGPGQVDDERLHLDRGSNEDPEGGTVGKIEAGASVGDREMDDPSDASDTGTVKSDEADLGGGRDEAEEAQRVKKPKP